MIASCNVIFGIDLSLFKLQNNEVPPFAKGFELCGELQGETTIVIKS